MGTPKVISGQGSVRLHGVLREPPHRWRMKVSTTACTSSYSNTNFSISKRAETYFRGPAPFVKIAQVREKTSLNLQQGGVVNTTRLRYSKADYKCQQGMKNYKCQQMNRVQ